MSIHTLPDLRTRVPFAARGPLSAAVIAVLEGGPDARADRLPELARTAARATDPVFDDDLQLSLFALYAIAYGSLDQLGEELEWDTDLISARIELERAFEASVRERTPVPDAPLPHREAVAETLFALTAPTPGPSLSRYLARTADREQALELDAGYGAYVDRVPAITLASFNLMTMFGLNRRLRGAAVGHLAAFEMTSSIPCRAIAEGLRRVGFDDVVADYYDEHVEADAVHEQIAGRDPAGSLAEDEPELLDDILFGAAACLTVDGWAGDHVLHAWEAGRSSLREPAGARA